MKYILTAIFLGLPAILAPIACTAEIRTCEGSALASSKDTDAIVQRFFADLTTKNSQQAYDRLFSGGNMMTMRSQEMAVLVQLKWTPDLRPAV